MDPNPSETRDLLDRLRRGDAAALERLLVLHREPLRRTIALRLDPALAGRLDASDVVQEVLLEASRRLDDYLRDRPMSFQLWLWLIAKDHVNDAHRRHRRAQRRSLDREQSLNGPAVNGRSSLDLLAQLRDQEATPATAAIRQELQRRVRGAIEALDEADREVLLLRHYQQLSNQEVAARLGLTEAAASMRCLRAVRRLHALLAPESDA
jgi:RNA polymerase sigma-70 factor (ECF subfamily)